MQTSDYNNKGTTACKRLHACIQSMLPKRQPNQHLTEQSFVSHASLRTCKSHKCHDPTTYSSTDHYQSIRTLASTIHRFPLFPTAPTHDANQHLRQPTLITLLHQILMQSTDRISSLAHIASSLIQSTWSHAKIELNSRFSTLQSSHPSKCSARF